MYVASGSREASASDFGLGSGGPATRGCSSELARASCLAGVNSQERKLKPPQRWSVGRPQLMHAAGSAFFCHLDRGNPTSSLKSSLAAGPPCHVSPLSLDDEHSLVRPQHA
jgi:hypothetical protein